MSCIGKFCSKKNDCKNFWANHLEQGIHQYIDWSAMGHGSCYINSDGEIKCEFDYYCGDSSTKQEHFVPIERGNEK